MVQTVESSTRITKFSLTLIDHILTNHEELYYRAGTLRSQ